MTAVLLGFEACLPISPGLFPSYDFHDGLRSPGGNLPVLRYDPLFDLIVGMREQCSGTQIGEISLEIGEDSVIQVIHEVEDLRLIGDDGSDGLAGLDLILEAGNPSIEIS